jgi:hypothetical protein
MNTKITKKIEAMSQEKLISASKKCKVLAAKHILNAHLYYKLSKLGTAMDYKASNLITWANQMKNF